MSTKFKKFKFRFSRIRFFPLFPLFLTDFLRNSSEHLSYSESSWGQACERFLTRAGKISRGPEEIFDFLSEGSAAGNPPARTCR